MKRLTFAFLLVLFCSAPAKALTTITLDGTEADWILGACIAVASGTPTVQVQTNVGEGAFITRCTLTTAAPCCPVNTATADGAIYGPFTHIKLNLTAAGAADVFLRTRAAP